MEKHIKWIKFQSQIINKKEEKKICVVCLFYMTPNI